MSTKRKAPSKIAQPVVKQSAKKATKANINESETAVTAPGISTDVATDKQDAIEISSDSASSEYEGSDDEGAEKEVGDASEAPATNGSAQTAAESSKAGADQDTEMASADDAESDQEPAQPTFGELARVEETIDVPSALLLPPTNALANTGRVLAPPSSASLGTVLTQALRTDDNDLLESCLHTTDLNTVANTIQRLDSSLAGTLLTKLASRMHRRPGRAGSLMTWVQWTLVAHGGALATQPGLAKKLGELHRVLEERSRGLTSLLSLKGKLDLLESQMQLRRGMRNAADSDDSDDDDDEQGVVYVEGEEEASGAGFDVEDDDDGLPVTNGFADDDSEGDEGASDLEDDEEDDEEELEGEEDLDENEVDHDDISSDEEDSEGEGEPAPPAKRSRVGAASKRR
ncbi:Dip2/Utp12 family-domain-containing protein [Microdochium trichocladiopsis]|uniref:Dip2/Utp12 family-domain-containing protein n=1 Tax=Microdochium trichocladiopsis TaxID=1682393 RepID=A0A9P9BTJ7_9PEZI|nr:Dip2/Utp12 family-domain-containing protein [Microdochium trichocladiopsis]KAH7040061.1 Dip2/Utp12 family-domain-containing protein [Microdochium trichocladiopsis]